MGVDRWANMAEEEKEEAKGMFSFNGSAICVAPEQH